MVPHRFDKWFGTPTFIAIVLLVGGDEPHRNPVAWIFSAIHALQDFRGCDPVVAFQTLGPFRSHWRCFVGIAFESHAIKSVGIPLLLAELLDCRREGVLHVDSRWLFSPLDDA